MIKYLVILLFAWFASGCEFTTNSPEEPIFLIRIELAQRVMQLIKCDSVLFQGTKMTENVSVTKDLEVTIKNPHNAPRDSLQMISVAKSICHLVKNGLKEPSNYDVFSVAFFTERINGIVTLKERNKISFNRVDLD